MAWETWEMWIREGHKMVQKKRWLWRHLRGVEMHGIIVTWNCRGAASKDFFRFSKYYTDIYKPEILVIMETRCNPKKLHGALKKLGFQYFLHVDNVGFSGGILVASKEENIKVSLISSGDQYIHLQAHNKNGQEWVFIVVYASPNEGKRKILWENLKNIANANNNNPWLVAGDFNDIAFANEKKGGGLASAKKCGIFRDNMDMCNLSDLGANGPRFTWRGPIYHGGQRIYERLDRAIGNEEWRLMFADVQVKVLTRVSFSDHHPIMIALTGSINERIPKPFRFESAWWWIIVMLID
ncbi:uncharacterized protein LOC131619982 [Vicia villosa]|uniref:uncharacterized protein LOC131619982 n=1 Tax=Vicia villosa TaxID=3911 RepID=UPI00273A9CE8|nr:uncharacterized protein LOC131619982 [Vicia villosa]